MCLVSNDQQVTNEQLYQEMQNYQEDEGSGEEEEKEVTAISTLEVWNHVHTLLSSVYMEYLILHVPLPRVNPTFEGEHRWETEGKEGARQGEKTKVIPSIV